MTGSALPFVIVPTFPTAYNTIGDRLSIHCPISSSFSITHTHTHVHEHTHS